MKWLGFLLWPLAALARLVLVVIGWFAVAVSLVAAGKHNTPPIWRMWADIDYPDLIDVDGDIVDASDWSTWDKYVWFAFRNPTPGLAARWKQPIPEVKPNPDELVRAHYNTKASRFMQHGIFWEYWSLSKMGNGKYWEFRIGWKFVDGNDHFYPTLQLGPKK